jgi:hypothetical protein
MLPRAALRQSIFVNPTARAQQAVSRTQAMKLIQPRGLSVFPEYCLESLPLVPPPSRARAIVEAKQQRELVQLAVEVPALGQRDAVVTQALTPQRRSQSRSNAKHATHVKRATNVPPTNRRGGLAIAPAGLRLS